jgi:hypothetical protein
MEDTPRQIILRAFEIKLLNLLGFFSTKALPGVDGDMKELIGKLQTSSYDQIGLFKVDSERIVALEAVLRYYIEQILESKLRSADVMKQTKNG